MKKFTFISLFFLFPLWMQAQQLSLHAADMAQGLAKLGVQGRVLYIAAHPDDENTRLLAYLSKEMKLRTGYLSLTRGDGGQNLIGNEQGELLGLIRTQELLAARRIDGAEQFFTRANDFGFSKTSDEAFKIWGKEQILADVVWVIRQFRPDLIITRFPEDARAGHGHHAGSAILAREAFSAAADPKRFPEQLQYVKVWQAKRLVWNTFNFGTNNTTSPDQLKRDVGLYNPLLGMGYGELAAISRTNHKSQGFGTALQRGEALEYFSPVAGEAAKADLFEGISLPYQWKNRTAQETYQRLLKDFNYRNPAASLALLLQLKAQIDDPGFNHPLLDALILSAAGIWADATTVESQYAKDESIPVKVQAIQRAGSQNKFPIRLSLNGQTSKALPFNQLITQELILPAAQAITQPYWLEAEHPIGQYTIAKQEWVGAPENPNPPSVQLEWIIGTQHIQQRLAVQYKYTDPIRGERYQPLIIAPPVTATLNDKVLVFTQDSAKTISLSLHHFGQRSQGSVKPLLPAGWRSVPAQRDFDLRQRGEEQQVSFDIIPPPGTHGGSLRIEVSTHGEINDRGWHSLHYEHIPPISLFPAAKARLEKMDLKTAGKQVAYIEGAGDLVPEALRQMGYTVTLLRPDQLAKANLTAFDAIVTGVRLYNVSEDMKNLQQHLLHYVEQGGTLLIQYNVNNGLKLADIGPYPFKLVNQRVTEEDAEVRFLLPNDPVLSYPNKISSKDFEGWIQERGLYFATDIDPHYRTPLSMNDTRESPANGALLVTDYGKGKFVYTSLVFFRELPAGVPGAYRLFANLLAPKAPSDGKSGK